MIAVIALRLTYRAPSSLKLPRYPGALWRGALGARLRADACITGAPTCEGCRVWARCAYGRLFEPPGGQPDSGLSARLPDAPRPYVVSPERAGGRWPAGETRTVRIHLLGDGIGELQAVWRAARRLTLHDVPLSLETVELVPPGGEASVRLTRPRAAEPHTIQAPPAPPSAVVTIDHPMRLKHKGAFLGPDGLNATALVTAAMRRLSALRERQGDDASDADYAALRDHAAGRVTIQEPALRWYNWQRRSARQQQRIPMGGVVGELTLTGDLEPVWPWLWAGQWAHIGKGAVMGLGRYRLQPLA